MEVSNVSFNKEGIGKLLLKFGVPTIISLLVIELYNMVDMVFVGRYVGKSAIAALTIAFPISKFLVSMGMLVAVGASTIVAAELGSKNEKNLIKAIINAFILMITLLFLAVVIIYLFKNKIIIALGASNIVFPLANKYITIALIGCIFQCVSMVLCYIMNSLGYTRVTLKSNILGLCINVIMNYVLVKIMNIGIEGAALSTDVSQLVALMYAFCKFRAIKLKFKIKFFDISILKKIIAIGFTSFIIEFSDAIIAVILNELLVVKGGDKAIIIVGIITKVSMFIYVTIIGISASMQPIVAYNYGAKNYDKMKKTLKLTIKVVVATSVISGSILVVLANSIIAFFLKDASILQETVNAFRISICVYPIMGVYYVCVYYYQAIDEAAKAFMFTIYGNLIVFIVALVFLVNCFGVIGAWVTYPVSQMITFLTAIYFIRKALVNHEQKSPLYNYHKQKYVYDKL